MIYDIFILSIVCYEPTGGDCYLSIHVLNASCSSALSLPFMPLLINSVFMPSI